MDNLFPFNIVDVAAFLLILVGLIRGFVKGLSGELAGLFSAAAAFAGAWYGYTPLGHFLMGKTILSERATMAVAFVLTLIGAYLAARLLRLILKSLMEFSFKGKIEKIGGLLAGGIRMTVVFAAFALLMTLCPQESLRRLFVEESVLGRFVSEKLGPLCEKIAEEHPALKIPKQEEPVEEADDEGAMIRKTEPTVDQEEPADRRRKNHEER